MAGFFYKATSADGESVSGEIDAIDRATAMNSLTGRGLSVESLEPAHRSSLPAAGESEPLELPPGVSLATGFQVLGEEMPVRRERQLYRRISDALLQGETLDEQLNRHSKDLAGWLIAVFRSGSESGTLAECMRHCVDFARRRKVLL